MDNNSIKENISSIRKKKGLTQEEMAHSLGISLTAYRDLEKGATSIINGNIYKIARLTGVTTEELVLGYRPEQSEGNIEDVRSEYGSKVENLMTRISDLEKIVASLEETVESKNEIIAMLKKNIDGKR
ncbi:MAG: helix-turn-helix transcriptional regulator [Bacteroidales bacterium]|nr:helix-turn-helix transcriptional regulator [Bacteroidales bacterium]